MQKPITYAPIPEFNQETQYVVQTNLVDKGDYIEAGVEIKDLPPQEEGEMVEGM